jgi:hypothetical protein
MLDHSCPQTGPLPDAVITENDRLRVGSFGFPATNTGEQRPSTPATCSWLDPAGNRGASRQLTTESRFAVFRSPAVACQRGPAAGLDAQWIPGNASNSISTIEFRLVPKP